MSPWTWVVIILAWPDRTTIAVIAVLVYLLVVGLRLVCRGTTTLVRRVRRIDPNHKEKTR